MKHRMIDGVLILLSISLRSQQTGAELSIPEQVVPQRIESVNGSDVNMGCTSPLVDSGDGVMVCNKSGIFTSYLLDGISPTINSSTSDWASQLVTVRKSEPISGGIESSHVFLTFIFDTAVTLAGIEVDVFFCPEWNISTATIDVYGSENRQLVFRTPSAAHFYASNDNIPSPSCDSQSTVTITPEEGEGDVSYRTWHILFYCNTKCDWIHVGEIRFLGVVDYSMNPSSIQLTSTSPNSTTLNPSSIQLTSTPLSTTPTSPFRIQFTSTSLSTAPTSPSSIQFTSTSLSSTPMSPSSIQLTSTLPHHTSMYFSSIQIKSISLNNTVSMKPSSRLMSAESNLIVSIISDTTKFSTQQPFSSTPLYINSNPADDTGTSVQQIDNVVVAVICGLVLLSLLLVPVVIGLYFIRKRCLLAVHQKVANDRDYELKDTGVIQNDPSHPDCDSDHHSAPTVGELDISNPMYMQTKDSTQTKIVTANGEEFTGMYNVITPIVSGTTSQHGEEQSDAYQTVSDITNVPQSKGLHTSKASEFIVSAGYATVQLGNEQCYALPNALDLTEAPKGKKSARPVHLQSHDQDLQPTKDIKGEESDIPICPYSVVQVKELPMVPPKSSDLELYLDRQSALNKSTTFFSEAINPADFTRNKMEGGESDPEIFAPIYTVSTVLPKSCQQPADVTSNNITERMVLGTGQFGQVVLAETNGLSLKTMGFSKKDNREQSITVAVKKVKAHPSQKQQDAFHREIKFISQLRHPNVLRLLGICYQDPAFIMMEYTEEGDLNQFVKRYSEIVTSPSNDTQIATSIVVYMASQIASAMQYLSKLNFVHRDLATRNCFIGKNCSIKLGDLGVDMNLYKTNYYRIRGNKLLPIRWMATECFSGRFSEKSDVWAFGITMWELFTLAKDVPYPHLSDEEVIHNALKREYRLLPSRAAACPQPVYEIMEQCWIIDLKQRVTFDKLHTMLQTSM